MGHFYDDPGAVSEPYGLGDGGSDGVGSFAAGLDDEINSITAEDNALVQEYGSAEQHGFTEPDGFTEQHGYAEPYGYTDQHGYAEPSPGFGSAGHPDGAAALGGWDVADQISASDYADFENDLTLDDGDGAIADADTADNYPVADSYPVADADPSDD